MPLKQTIDIVETEGRIEAWVYDYTNVGPDDDGPDEPTRIVVISEGLDNPILTYEDCTVYVHE